ncbi:MAG TPA: hypothetical protein ENN60_00120 [archaeon]|nr:hypothetical protein [archaeon]
MIQMGIVGDDLETAFFAAKRGFLVMGLDPRMDSPVRKAGVNKFVLFGDSEILDSSIRLNFPNKALAVAAMVDSADILVITGGGDSELVKSVATVRHKPVVEGKGQETVELAAERVVRYNLFGKKKG